MGYMYVCDNKYEQFSDLIPSTCLRNIRFMQYYSDSFTVHSIYYTCDYIVIHIHVHSLISRFWLDVAD